MATFCIEERSDEYGVDDGLVDDEVVDDVIVDDGVLDGDGTLDGNEEERVDVELDEGEMFSELELELEELDEPVVVMSCCNWQISNAVSFCMQTNAESQSDSEQSPTGVHEV